MAHIVIIDDDPHVRTLLVELVDLAGHEADAHPGAASALEAVAARTPDLILLDLCMPEMDGWRFLDELYRRGLRARTRVIVVTAAAARSRKRARQAGVRRVIAKPFEPEDLLQAIEESLSAPPSLLLERTDRSDELVRLVQRVDATRR